MSAAAPDGCPVRHLRYTLPLLSSHARADVTFDLWCIVKSDWSGAWWGGEPGLGGAMHLLRQGSPTQVQLACKAGRYFSPPTAWLLQAEICCLH